MRSVLKLTESLVSNMAPIRVGIVFSTDDDTKITGFENAGVAMVCAYNYMSQMKNTQAGLNLLIEVKHIVHQEKFVFQLICVTDFKFW